MYGIFPYGVPYYAQPVWLAFTPTPPVPPVPPVPIIGSGVGGGGVLRRGQLRRVPRWDDRVPRYSSKEPVKRTDEIFKDTSLNQADEEDLMIIAAFWIGLK